MDCKTCGYRMPNGAYICPFYGESYIEEINAQNSYQQTNKNYQSIQSNYKNTQSVYRQAGDYEPQMGYQQTAYEESTTLLKSSAYEQSMTVLGQSVYNDTVDKNVYIKIEKLKKAYGTSGNYVQVLKGIDCKIEKGEIVIILGPSGSGKSTLLNLIAGLESIDSGKLVIDNCAVEKMNDKDLADYRRSYLGFVFQFYNLVPNLTVRENITLCARLSKNPLDANELIKTLGLSEHQNKYPAQLSGGQQQRCAIARALIKNPSLLLCDEPTGALDSKTAKEILILLEKINRWYDTTMLIITHNADMKDMANRVIRIKDGLIQESYVNSKQVPAEALTF